MSLKKGSKKYDPGTHFSYNLQFKQNNGVFDLKGLTTVFDHKKWVFAYFVTALSFMHLEGPEIMAIMLALIPVTIGASSFDKSQWRKE